MSHRCPTCEYYVNLAIFHKFKKGITWPVKADYKLSCIRLDENEHAMQ